MRRPSPQTTRGTFRHGLRLLRRRGPAQGTMQTRAAARPKERCKPPPRPGSRSVAPDGDAEVDRTHDFRYPDCADCGGMLKPDVVYFGENAPREVTERAHAMLDVSDALLVLGTSLSVMSGLRFLRRSAKDGRPVVIVNDGATRGDDLAALRLHGRIAPVLRRWIDGANG
ncbi:MAG: hypothetical protein IPJ61_14270 [Tessaracoccus sp.]|nr:hypothetical protein [Tessaracoccus sp.]